MRVALEMGMEVDLGQFNVDKGGTRIAYSHSSVGRVCTSEEAIGCAVKHRHLGPATISMQSVSAKIHVFKISKIVQNIHARAPLHLSGFQE